ncbi:hypothetical protein [Nocardioides dongkuii]|uniref:hypothetical protein n=1 Tax=Nocardioides dongkuii TaxID=2760089 RepID=UPI0015FBEA34|nr:hypothetical protein [Nocardioides dongkuii]
MRRTAIAALVLSTACPVTGCSLLSDSSSDSSPSSPSADLEEALDVVPDTATSVTYVGRAAAAERLEIDDVETGADEEDVDRYLEGLRESMAATTTLTDYLPQMQEAAFSDLDLEWEVSAQGDDGMWVVWRIDDDVDLDEVADDMVAAGYEETEEDGGRHLRSSLGAASSDGRRYPVEVMMSPVLVPDEHLIIVSPDPEAVLEVITDDGDSVLDAEDLDEVVDAADDAEFAHLRRDIDCGAVYEDGPLSPEETEQLNAASGLEDLGRPDATGFFVHGDDAGTTTTVLAFADDDAAKADATAREAWLEGEPLLASGGPFTQDATWDVETDGPLVRIDHDYGTGDASTASSLAFDGDGFALCAP